MLEQEVSGSQVDHDIFEVRSQTNPDQYCLVIDTGDGLICSCPDHTKNHADCKHIKVILHKISTKRCYSNHLVKIMERSKFKVCKFCDSDNIKKDDMRNNKSGKIQRWECQECKKRFTAKFGFEKMRYDDVLITMALQMYFQGLSVREIADGFEQEGFKIYYVSVFNWIAKYSDMTSKYLDTIVPRVGNWFRSDEV